MNFSDYIKENRNYGNEQGKNNANENNVNLDDVNGLYNKYSGLTYNELIREFFEKSKSLKSSGVLNEAKINNLKEVLFPYLNQEQQQNFINLINMVNNDK